MYSYSKIYRKFYFFPGREKVSCFHTTTKRFGNSQPAGKQAADPMKDLVTYMKPLFLVPIDFISDGAHLIQEC